MPVQLAAPHPLWQAYGLLQGLFGRTRPSHPKIKNIKAKGGITRSVKFPGVNMDIGHVRNLIWHKKDDKSAWIAYNQMRGQYKSLMEGAIPQAFFSDPNQCNTKNDPQSTLPACKGLLNQPASAGRTRHF